ncbi:ECF transporter S component [Allofournierella sp.]|uniref:ECF transporter S component n=1 Tax=Allofournierella sp. TaxID=1940256 RepID=UPI003AB1CB17
MKNRKNLRYLTQLSVLLALELILAYTPLGYLRVLPGLEISFLMIPVTLGAMLLGPAAGAVLGGAFGLTSFGTCFGSSAFGATLLAVNPLFTFLTCVPTRILAGWLAGLLFRILTRRRATQALEPNPAPRPAPGYAFGAAALAGPVLNTLLFTGALVLFFYHTAFIQGFVTSLGAANPLTFMVLFVGVQGLVEAAVGFAVSGLLGPAVYAALRRGRV